MKRKSPLLLTALIAAAVSIPPAALGQDEDDGPGLGVARVSLTNGDVTVRRGDSGDWIQAEVNMPLVEGDSIATGRASRAEVQLDYSNLLRLNEESELNVAQLANRSFRVQLERGIVTYSELQGGEADVDIETPLAAIRPRKKGAYRIEVFGQDRVVVTVRDGEAHVASTEGIETLKEGRTMVIRGAGDSVEFQTLKAESRDDWDRWNERRDDQLRRSESYRYVSRSISGAHDLDGHGHWTYVSGYGRCWFPTVAAGWAPYSYGRWIWLDYYGWSWVGYEPWGWAPYHYGRWVFVDSVWAWAPGPVLVRPVYAPALVAFFGGGPSVRVSVGGPVVGWVALGWGEPVVPWWGPVAFVGRPWWGGWGGPRVVNNVVVNRHTVVNVQNITVYRNATVQNALVAVHQERFGRGPIGATRVKDVDRRNFEPIRGPLHVRPEPASFTPTTARGVRPPDERRVREVVATRAPRQWSGTHSEETKRAPGSAEAPPPRIVPAPRDVSAPAASRSGRDQKRSDAPQLTAPRPDGGRLDAPATPRGEPRASSNRESSRAPEPSIVPPARSPGVQGQQAGPGSERRSRGPEMGAPTSPQGPSPVAPAPGDQGKREPRAFGAPPSAPPVTPRSQPGVERPAPRPESNPSSAAAPSQPSREPRMQLPTPTPQPPAGVEGQPRRSERPSSRPEMTAPQPPRPQMTVPPRTPAQPGPERPPQRPEMGAPQPAPPSGPQPRSEPPARRPEVSRPPAPPPAQPTREPRVQPPAPARVESQPQRQEREPGKSSPAEPSRRSGENDRRGKG